MSTTVAAPALLANRKAVVYRTPLPRLSRLLAQSAAAAVLGHFLIVIAEVLYVPQFYNFLFIPALPVILGCAVGFGVVGGFAIWGCMRLFRRKFGRTVRTLIVGFFSALLAGGHWVLFPPDPWQPPHNELFVFAMFPVLAIGLIAGSYCNPARALSYGLCHVKPQQPMSVTIVGFALRLAIIFGCLESMLALICVLQVNYQNRDLIVVLLVLGYFLAGTVITFVNPKFWLTAIIASLLNAPWAFVLTKFSNEPNLIWWFILAYLLLWVAFLLARYRVLDAVFSVIKEEIRYYLID